MERGRSSVYTVGRLSRWRIIEGAKKEVDGNDIRQSSVIPWVVATLSLSLSLSRPREEMVFGFDYATSKHGRWKATYREYKRYCAHAGKVNKFEETEKLLLRGQPVPLWRTSTTRATLYRVIQLPTTTARPSFLLLPSPPPHAPLRIHPPNRMYESSMRRSVKREGGTSFQPSGVAAAFN